MVVEDLRRDQRSRLLTDAYKLAPDLVDAIWGDRESFAHEVLDLWSYHKARARWPVAVERGVPYLRATDRVDYEHGTGAHQLDPLLDDLLADRKLFPRGLKRPAGGIRWDDEEAPYDWAYYEQQPQRISVSTFADSDQVPPGVLRYLVYHELLHHEDALTPGREEVNHDANFYDRQAIAAETVDAEGWIDSWPERFVVQEAPEPKP
jgi:hypothetical protein